MEDERIKAVSNWPEPKLVRYIQVFIGFPNFYWRFIRDFNKRVKPLISILRTIRSSDLPQRDNNDEVVEAGNNDKNLTKSKRSKNVNSGIQTCIKATGKSIFLTPDAKEAFNQFKQVFTKALILWYFDPEWHIQI